MFTTLNSVTLKSIPISVAFYVQKTLKLLFLASTSQSYSTPTFLAINFTELLRLDIWPIHHVQGFQNKADFPLQRAAFSISANSIAVHPLSN